MPWSEGGPLFESLLSVPVESSELAIQKRNGGFQLLAVTWVTTRFEVVQHASARGLEVLPLALHALFCFSKLYTFYR